MTAAKTCASFMLLALVVMATDGCRPNAEPPAESSTDGTLNVETPMVLDVAERYELGLVDALGLAVHPDGGLLVAHRGGVRQLDGRMQVVRDFPTATAAVDAVVDSAGQILVAERTGVLVFDGQGREVNQWRGPPAPPPATEGAVPESAAEPFIAITALAVDGDFIRIADAGVRAIFRFDRTGDFADLIGGRNPGPGMARIVCPSPFLGVDVDAAGMLVVGNPGRHRIEYYDRNHRLVRHWGRPGDEPGQFPGCCNPTNLVGMSDGRVVVSEKGVPRVKVYDSQGRLLALIGPDEFSPNAQGIALAIGRGGEIFALDPVTSRLLVLTLRERQAP